MEVANGELWWIEAAAAAWFFYLGAAVGSFCNVVAARMPRGVSFTFGGSRCPHCGRPVRPRDNVPILSWLVLRGRCRDCGGRISPRYFLVELAYGTGFFSLYVADLVLAGPPPDPLGWLARPASLGPFAFHAALFSLLGVAWMMQFQGDQVPKRLWAWGAAVGVAGLYLFGNLWIGAGLERGAIFPLVEDVFARALGSPVDPMGWTFSTTDAALPLILLGLGLAADGLAGRARPAGAGPLRVFPAFSLVAVYLPLWSLALAPFPVACYWVYRFAAGRQRASELAWTTICLIYAGALVLGGPRWEAELAPWSPAASPRVWRQFAFAWAAALAATALAAILIRRFAPAPPDLTGTSETPQDPSSPAPSASPPSRD